MSKFDRFKAFVILVQALFVLCLAEVIFAYADILGSVYAAIAVMAGAVIATSRHVHQAMDDGFEPPEHERKHDGDLEGVPIAARVGGPFFWLFPHCVAIGLAGVDSMGFAGLHPYTCAVVAVANAFLVSLLALHEYNRRSNK